MKYVYLVGTFTSAAFMGHATATHHFAYSALFCIYALLGACEFISLAVKEVRAHE